ncbi:phosphoribosyltransferase family protein [Aliivibrio fischeri]|uniref:phosphoribosyltransferase family protein n=1 Tax=Aliivibrio fischeri TaxID=668 RepID=UPI003F76292E
MNYKSYKDLSDDIRNNLSKIHACNVDLVVGLPRSGLTPANMIALYLNVACTDFDSFINDRKLKKGKTRKSKTNIEYPHDAKNILLVDDSIRSGSSLHSDLLLIPENLRSKVTTCAIYSSLSKRDDVDMFLEVVPIPRVFEWNLFHHSITSKACFDIDGVLCVYPTKEQNDDGEKYIDFILNAEPLFIPTNKVHALVTSRLEKYRKETEIWLNKHNIEYEHLIMLDLPNKEERQKLGVHGFHKAKYYKSTNTSLFVESEYNQSVEILNITNKPVFCVDENIMLRPGQSYFIKKKVKDTFFKSIINLIPLSIKRKIKNFKSRVK